MKTTLSVYDFRDGFHRCGRGDQFSYDALGIIYDWLEEYDPDFELDVIGLCCDLAEDEPRGIAEDYSIDVSGMDDEETEQEVLNYLHDQTTVLGQTKAGTIIYVQF